MGNDPPIILSFLRLRPDVDADIPLPRYMTPQASGMDICAAVEHPPRAINVDVRSVSRISSSIQFSNASDAAAAAAVSSLAIVAPSSVSFAAL